ncbi:MAG: metallophosphoesterase [Oscillospiraceae bacterium]|jgi:predicted phosphohydrolase|nr:metallophosphoesterase [Oscillospiraceae bacterium]
MALFAIGDLHLSLASEKPMDVFGGGWEGYVDKIKLGFERVAPDDTVILCGDLSWGMTINESLADFRFIGELPGKKIILKGNHDYWFETVAKAKKFFEQNDIPNIEILNNNHFIYDEGAARVAICGTRGWLYDENMDGTHNGKIMAREVIRLEASLKSAPPDAGKICFFHYPPRFKNYVCADIIAVMEQYGVKRCWYGHIHGAAHRFAVTGTADGIEYNMVSADYLKFIPQRVCFSQTHML